MPTLVIPKTYRDGKAPRVADLDNIRLSVEAFFNDTKLDNANIDLAAITAAITAAQAESIITTAELGEITEQANTTSTPSVTVVDSGYYIVYAQADFSLEVGTAGTNTTYISESSVISLEVNGVAAYTQTLESNFTIRPGGGTFQSITYGHVGGFTIVQSLTQGDVLTLNVPGSISVIKLYET